LDDILYRSPIREADVGVKLIKLSFYCIDCDSSPFHRHTKMPQESDESRLGQYRGGSGSLSRVPLDNGSTTREFSANAQFRRISLEF